MIERACKLRAVVIWILSGRSLNLFPIGNRNIACRLTDGIRDANTIAPGESCEVMSLRQTIAGDLKEIAAAPCRVPQSQRPVRRPRQDAAFVPAEQRAGNRSSCLIAGPIGAPVAASHSRSVLSPTTTGCGFRPG